MNLAYLVPRVIRHFLPEKVVRFLLLRSIIIKPGLETEDPQAAIRRYVEILESRRVGLRGKRVLVFGYGGRFDIGVALLGAGAGYVVLCDRYAHPDDSHNATLRRSHAAYIVAERNRARPNPEHMRVIDGDVRLLPPPAAAQRFDVVISNSVYEHVDDATGITKALADWTKPDGLHIHFVDLRDHYFRYPFEMLKFSETTWRTLLNPTSNHNRLRLWDYRRIFEGSFGSVEIDVLARDETAFASAESRIRPQFISGNAQEDSATLIRIVAARPGV